MIWRLRIRVLPRANPSACPRCLSLDTWQWNREPFFLRPLTTAFGLTRLTCRGCANEFYQRVDPWALVVGLLGNYAQAPAKPMATARSLSGKPSEAARRPQVSAG